MVLTGLGLLPRWIVIGPAIHEEEPDLHDLPMFITRWR
jgi:hypothetical protein